ncbi:TetR/AcrR family transcriptional regulator [Arthrobacter frigidicola]|nr:TetR/AcrR family transcriptional regulator [Arthrobacter frigidicola]
MGTTLTAKGAATRQRIIQGAATLIQDQGISSTSLDDIAARTQTGKSQLFHYFPEGKTALLVAVAEFEAASILADQQPYLSNLTSWDAWQDWRNRVVERYEAQGRQCRLGVLTTQLGPASAASEKIAADLQAEWERLLLEGIQGMQQSGHIRPSVDAAAAAAALIAGIYGGVLILLASGSAYHLASALDVGIASLRGH